MLDSASVHVVWVYLYASILLGPISYSYPFSILAGLLSCTLPNGFGGLTGPEGERSLAPPDASILISNVCSIGDHVAQELFQSSDLGTSEEAERTGEKAGQHSPLREEHVTCVQSKPLEDLSLLLANSKIRV